MVNPNKIINKILGDRHSKNYKRGGDFEYMNPERYNSINVGFRVNKGTVTAHADKLLRSKFGDSETESIEIGRGKTKQEAFREAKKHINQKKGEFLYKNYPSNARRVEGVRDIYFEKKYGVDD